MNKDTFGDSFPKPGPSMCKPSLWRLGRGRNRLRDRFRCWSEFSSSVVLVVVVAKAEESDSEPVDGEQALCSLLFLHSSCYVHSVLSVSWTPEV